MHLATRGGLSFLLLFAVLGVSGAQLETLDGSTIRTSSAQSEIEVIVIFSGPSLEAFRSVTDAFEDAHPEVDVRVDRPPNLVEVLFSRVRAGNPPDISVIPNPGQLRELVAGVAQPGQSDVVPLDFLGETLDRSYMEAFVDLGTFEGPDGSDKVYGLMFSANAKSLVWYNPNVLGADFALDSWDELIGFAKGSAAAGKPAWCIGLESGGGTGWPGTDWIEDVLLRAVGPETYDAWVSHDIPWTDGRVKRAWERFGEIVRNPDYVLGGPEGAISINFRESPNGLFTDPPGCYLHRQASFIQTFITEANPDLAPIEDFNVFLFPPVEENGHGRSVIGGGSITAMFNDTPVNREFMRFLASAEAQSIWAEAGGQEPPANLDADVSSLGPIDQRLTQVMRTADVFRFDASDLMPAALGSGAFWTGVVDYVLGKDVCEVLRELEVTADRVYESGNATNGTVETGACPIDD